MTRTYAKNQGQMPRGSKVSVETKGIKRTERRTGTTEFITFHANAAAG